MNISPQLRQERFIYDRAPYRVDHRGGELTYWRKEAGKWTNVTDDPAARAEVAEAVMISFANYLAGGGW